MAAAPATPPPLEETAAQAMAAAPPSPPPSEVTAAQARLVFECRLEICTIEALEGRLRGMQAEASNAAAVLERHAAGSAMAARWSSELRILASATEAIKLGIVASRTSLLAKVDEDPFLRQFLV